MIENSKFSPVSAWASLPTRVQSLLGPAAVAHVFGLMGYNHGVAPREQYEVAEREAFYLLDELCRQYLPAAFGDDGTPLLPDLSLLGIETCT